MTNTTQNTNKVSIQSLIQGNKDGTMPLVSNNSEPSLSLSQEQRFLTIKHKVYTLILWSLVIIFYGTLVGAFQNSKNKWDQAQLLTQTINQRIDDQHDYQLTTDYITTIEDHKSQIIACINHNEQCKGLGDNIQSNLETVKSYIQIGSLQKPKMQINESKILKSINEFMTKSTLSGPDERKYNGIVTDIAIGDNTVLENNIIQVPVSLTITFNGQDNLIDFLHNLENKIYYDQIDGLNNSILYTIQEIKYDIVNYKQSQDVQVLLYAYAYNK